MKLEGFWRQRESDTLDPLPWPVAGETVDGYDPDVWEPERRDFLDKLAVVESHAASAGYRGHSYCRLCGVENGSRTFILDEWQWPSGYWHYVEVHNVRPSPEFERFVTAYGYIAGHLDQGDV